MADFGVAGVKPAGSATMELASYPNGETGEKRSLWLQEEWLQFLYVVLPKHAFSFSTCRGN